MDAGTVNALNPPSPFDVKHVSLLTDPVRGWSAVHPEAQAMLLWICETSLQRGWPRPTVTCFGRTRDDQEAIYLPGMEQRLSNEGVSGPAARDAARLRARARFSWHCIPRHGVSLGKCRAFDLRDWIYTEAIRVELEAVARKRFPGAEILDHAVPGGARHFHFAARAESRPLDWL